MSTEQHRVKFKLDGNGWGIYSEIICPGGDISCRVESCPHGCENCYPPQRDDQGWFHLAYDSGLDADVKHRMTFIPAESSFCNYAEWISSRGNVDESYEGPAVPPRDGPIEFEWDGDNWLWHYASEETK